MLFVMMIALNVFWYALILKGVKKLLISKGVIKGEKIDSYENV